MFPHIDTDKNTDKHKKRPSKTHKIQLQTQTYNHTIKNTHTFTQKNLQTHKHNLHRQKYTTTNTHTLT